MDDKLYGNIPLSKRFRDLIHDPRFEEMNAFSTEEVIAYWQYHVDLANEFEKRVGIQPSLKRIGVTLEDMAEVRYKGSSSDPSFLGYLKQHFNGKMGFSLYSIDPEDKVPTSYAALNQLQAHSQNSKEDLKKESGKGLEKDTEKELLLSLSTPFNWGLRMVHEDTHNHQYFFEGEQGRLLELYLNLGRAIENLEKHDSWRAIKELQEFMAHGMESYFDLFYRKRVQDHQRFVELGSYVLQYPLHEDFSEELGKEFDISYVVPQELKRREAGSPDDFNEKEFFEEANELLTDLMNVFSKSISFSPEELTVDKIRKLISKT